MMMWLGRILLAVFCAGMFAVYSCSQGDSEGENTFSLKLVGKEYGPHNGQQLKIAVLNRTDKLVVKTAELTVENDEFTIEWPGLLKESGDYFVDFFADLNKNGVCDAPFTDHSWRIKVNNVSADEILNDTHNMNFTDVCKSFSDSPFSQGGGTQVTLTGNLSLSNDIEDIEGLTGGQKLQGATVFVENYPESETRSDKDGNFELVFNTNALTLTETSLHVVMWYTKESDHGAGVWDDTVARVGARQSVPIDGAAEKVAADLSGVPLTYTARGKLRLRDKDSQEAVTTCWIEIPAYSFQLFFRELGDGYFSIDYLPAGTYKVIPHCYGYKEAEYSVTVPRATSTGETADLGVLDLEKSVI